MWRVLRAELSYSRPWLLGAFGIAVGVAILITLIFRVVDDAEAIRNAVGLRAMFVIMGPLIVCFIVQGYRSEERRARLLLAGPMTPRQMALVNTLLPVAFCLVGLAAGSVSIGLDLVLDTGVSSSTLYLAGYVGSLLFMMAFLGLLVQESVAAYRQQRRAGAGVGWTIFVLAVLVQAGLSAVSVITQGQLGWPELFGGNLVIAAAASSASVILHSRRTDFTR